MTTSRQSGFTLIEIIVVIAILGILAATAVPVYHTWQQRAYGSEAKVMMKQILDAEISYYLENNEFYPDAEILIIYADGTSDPSTDVKELIKQNLNIDIPTGHKLWYSFCPDSTPGSEAVLIQIGSESFELFKGYMVWSATLSKTGSITYEYL